MLSAARANVLFLKKMAFRFGAEDCMNGCPWTSLMPRARGNNPFCHLRAIAWACAGPQERRARVTAGPAELCDHRAVEAAFDGGGS
jgi:hypothetical protein